MYLIIRASGLAHLEELLRTITSLTKQSHYSGRRYVGICQHIKLQF